MPGSDGPTQFQLTPGKRVLYLTKDPALIRRQLSGELNLTMKELSVADLLDDINTDAMTPAWVCFDHDPRSSPRTLTPGSLSTASGCSNRMP